MPYLQLDLEAKKLVPRVARALGVPDAQIGWGLIELWDWCWNEKRDTVSGLMLRGFFGCAGDLSAFLTDFGFLEELGDGNFRVKGAGARLRVFTAQSEAGKKHAANLIPGARQRKSLSGRAEREPEVEPRDTSGSDWALTPNTQSPNTQTTKTPIPPSGAGEALELLPREPKAPAPEDEVMAYYLEAMGAQPGKRPRKTPKGMRQIRARLGEGLSVEELKAAIDGLTYSEHHMRGGFTSIGYALRSAEQVEMMTARVPSNEPERRRL